MPESENPDASKKHTEVDSSNEGASEASAANDSVWSDTDLSNYTASGGRREGSPFAVDPEPLSEDEFDQGPMSAEVFYDIGPMRYVALGAVLAATLVVLFAAASAYWFPGGGVLVAGLGCVLAILGLFSPRPRTAGGLLIVHLGLFVTAFVRMV